MKKTSVNSRFCSKFEPGNYCIQVPSPTAIKPLGLKYVKIEALQM
jgi:hypothetical protein